ncbi:MAG: DUF5317 family protein [Acidimicrobiales bacterium]
MILPLAFVVGLVAGGATHGTFRALARLRLDHVGVVAAALAMQIALGAAGLHPSTARSVIVIGSDVAVGWFLACNAAAHQGRALRAGFGLLATGWLANLAAMAANGGMPVSRAAMREAGLPASFQPAAGHLAKHGLATAATLLPYLGDVIPLRALRAVVSPGDCAMALGLVLVLAGAMHLSTRGQPAGFDDPCQETSSSLISRLPEHLRRWSLLDDRP